MQKAATAQQSPSLFSLFLFFLRFGLTAFGGPAMIAYIRQKVVEEKKWLNGDSFRSGIAICQSIPGATAMQMATYVGLRKAGVLGALVSFLGFILPPFALMIALSVLYMKTHNLPQMISVFNGLQVIIVAIVANATLAVGLVSLKDWPGAVIALLSALMFALNMHPILVIILAGLLGIVIYSRLPFTNQGKREEESFSFRPLFLIILIIFLSFILLFLYNSNLFSLGLLMMRIDLFAFGGGFASLPIMFHEVVNLRQWMDGATFLNGIALGQVTPGPIVITATFIGYYLYGFWGGLVATLSIFFPSFLLVVGVTPHYDRLCSSPYFNRAVAGAICAFVGLLLSATLRFTTDIPWDILRISLVAGAFFALAKKVDLLWVLLAGTIISVLFL